MAWSQLPTGQTRIRDLRSETNYEFAGRTLEEELSGTIITPTSMADYNALVASTGITGTSGYVLESFEHFDVKADGVTLYDIGDQPDNVTGNAPDKTAFGPRPHFWVPGRGLIANLPVPAPGDTRIKPDGENVVNLYQILAPSVLGMGMTHIPGVITAQSSMQTMRNGPLGEASIPERSGQYDFDSNVSYMTDCYAYYECRQRVPLFGGSWTGFWMKNADEWNTPEYPVIEIDWSELYTSPQVPGGTYAHHFTPWLHRPSPAKSAKGYNVRDIFPSTYESIYEADGTTPVDFTADFHLIGGLMTPDWIICYYNRKEIHRTPMLPEWRKNYYLILSHQVQIQFAALNQNTVGWYEIDYVMTWVHPTIKALFPARPTPYEPPAFSPPIKAIDVLQLEKGIAQKWGIESALPPSHPARTIDHSDASIAPEMPEQLVKTLANNKTDGYSFGTCAVINSPTRPVIYSGFGPDADDFDVNMSTGEVTLKAGATLTEKVHKFAVVASTEPPTPTVLGKHATRVLLDMRADDDFDLRYFDQKSLAKPVSFWIDFFDTARYVLDDDDKLLSLIEKSSYGWGDAGFGKSVQADAARRPGFSLTGINGYPAMNGGSGINFKVPSFVGSDVFGLVVSKANGVIGVNSNGTKDTATGSYSFNSPTVLWAEVVGDFNNPATVDNMTININGVDRVVTTTMNNMKAPFAIICVFEARTAGGGSLGRIFDATGGFLNNVTTGAGSYFDGYLGLFGFIYNYNYGTPFTQEEKDKTIGYAHWAFGLEDNLPIDHPYRSVRPKMWN